ncbi:hypothetical protein CCL16_05430 [Pseudomonas syringae]|nr:hypothetical protein CCL12_24035 [Pseudomonas syringae]PBP35426.1 hypothetical protein CCL11_24740 [Pseudomonas syringae]PBP47368.1 hypothetical protein CCL11_08905 [Pseudomonas syringae]PBP69678.1 hypothetical protein CCL21_12410 [Pseudomonas syringae]PBP92015.1 hypothetical protein CCL16_05430 [Pseudomonas syringae]
MEYPADKDVVMNVDQAVDTVYARLVEKHSIPEKIRFRVEVSDEEVSELFLAVDFLIEYYKGRAVIPKRLALAFVDVYVGFNVSDDVYDERERCRYEDIGIALQQKAYDLFD